ncbi:MAG: type II-A CRISPR-associated protein Csn2 [Lachnospiraceae bacterium]|nr:type II-A CRISPR-associated protein Csn2 [Lachnospiraceae bacterium]
MKLVHPDLQFQIEFAENTIPVCIIESPVRWRKIQKEMFSQCQGGDGSWVLSTGEKELKLNKSVEMIFNPLQLEENQRRILNGVLQSICQMAVNERYWKKGQELNTTIQGFFAELEMEYPFEYQINEEIDFSALAKAMGIRIEQEYETDLERLLQYCILAKEILKANLIIFWNLHNYFSVQELESLYQEISVRKWNVLLMENSVVHKIPVEKYYIIDKDNCEIY